MKFNKRKYIIVLFLFFLLFSSNCNVNNIILKQRRISKVYVINKNLKIKYELKNSIWNENKEKKSYFRRIVLDTFNSDLIVKYRINNNGFLKRVTYKNNTFSSKPIISINRNKDNLITKMKMKNYHKIITQEEFIYKEDYFVLKRLHSDSSTSITTYKLDTSIVCFFPHYLVTSYNTDFFMYSNFLFHPITFCFSDEGYFSKFSTTIDSANYATKIIEYSYKISNYKDTILTDSTVFEIFYEE